MMLYSFLTERYYQQTLSSRTIYFAIDLLRKFISQQIPKQNEPSTFFYFTGQNSGLVTEQQTPITWTANNVTPCVLAISYFLQGFALSIWFHLDGDQLEENPLIRKPYMKLFTLHCEGHGGVEAYFVGRDLYYRTIGRIYSEPTNNEPTVLLGNFKLNKWNYLGIEHTNGKGIGKPCLRFVVNEELREPVEIQFPNIENNLQISKFSIGENFIGRISSVMLFKAPIAQNK